MSTNQKGFTLLEVVSVITILGILIVFAVSRYINTPNEARIKAAESAIAEIKGRLSNAQGKYIIVQGKHPTSSELLAYAKSTNGGYGAANLVNVGPDYVVSIQEGPPIVITVGIVLSNSQVSTYSAVGD